MSSKYFHKKNKVRKVKNLIEIECYEYKKNKKIKILIKYNVIKIEKLKKFLYRMLSEKYKKIRKIIRNLK